MCKRVRTISNTEENNASSLLQEIRNHRGKQKSTI
jgi:hypothetical protein